jgi:hypothetical protein
VQTAILKNAFYRVGQGAMGVSLWNKGGSGMKMFGNHSYRVCRAPMASTIEEILCGMKATEVLLDKASEV